MAAMSSRSGFDPQLLQEAQQGAALMANMATRTNLTKVGDRTGGESSLFPVQISSTDPEDQKYALRKNIVADGPNVAGVGMAVADEGYFNYAKRKQDAQQEAAFKAWVLQNADLSTPASSAWWYKTIPWMKENREGVISYVADLQKRAALIALNGPQTEDDFRFVFMQEQEMIKIPTQPVHMLNEWEVPDGTTYESGFFSPFAQKYRAGRTPINPSEKTFTWSNPLTPGQDTATIPALFRGAGIVPQ